MLCSLLKNQPLFRRNIFHAGFLFIFFNPEDWYDMFLWNSGWLSVVCTVFYCKSYNSSWSVLWERQILQFYKLWRLCSGLFFSSPSVNTEMWCLNLVLCTIHWIDCLENSYPIISPWLDFAVLWSAAWQSNALLPTDLAVLVWPILKEPKTIPFSSNH
jgi:hypothetical protein